MPERALSVGWPSAQSWLSRAGAAPELFVVSTCLSGALLGSSQILGILVPCKAEHKLPVFVALVAVSLAAL